MSIICDVFLLWNHTLPLIKMQHYKYSKLWKLCYPYQYNELWYKLQYKIKYQNGYNQASQNLSVSLDYQIKCAPWVEWNNVFQELQQRRMENPSFVRQNVQQVEKSPHKACCSVSYNLTYPYGAPVLVVSQLAYSFHTPLDIVHLVQDISQIKACLEKERNNYYTSSLLIY